MSNSNYVRGREREYRSMNILRNAGYEPHRMAGSKGVWDVIGISGLGMVLVQVKYQRKPSRSERIAMEEYQAPANAQKYVHFYIKGQFMPEIIPVPSRKEHMLKLGTHVRYKPHWPGDTWDTEPWWICGRIIMEDHWRQPIIQYKVARANDPGACHTIDCCVRDDQLMPWSTI